MKIVCDNCSAKYSIADEKVAGKVFKIRCKKCTNVIVVRGDQIAAAEEEEAATQVFDYGSDQVWHVVVDGDQQGPFAPLQLGMMITEGTIDWEAYVWKEGFDGWKPARDVPELVTAISGEQPADDGAAAAAGGAAAGAAAGGMGEDPFAGGGDDPFAGGGEDAFAGGGAAAAADPGADLFAGGGEAASPFGGDEAAAGDDDVVASPSPRVSQEQAMTGARNENSVLFSLSNLQALATGDGGGGGEAPSPAPVSSGPAPGHASGEGSGLIDIRALASATAATSGGGGGGGGGGGADDLLSIGGSGGIGSSLGAPVLAPAAPEPEEGNKKMLAIFGVVGLLVVGLVVALIVVLTREPAPVAQAGAPGANTAGPGTPETPAATEAAGNAAEAATQNAGQPVTGTMTEEADESDDEGGEEEVDEGGDEGSSSSRRRRRSRRSRSGSSSGSSDSSAMSDPEPAAMRSAMGSIDDLLDQAIGGGGGMSSRMSSAMAASNLPAQPSRDDVGRALRGVAGRVAGCGNGTSGVANAAISFASSGRVRSVRVTGVPPAVQSCVSRGVRSARVPAFSRNSFSVNFPFRVR